MKKFLLAAALILTSLPAMAHNTQPTDRVSVEASTYDSDGAIVLSNKVYIKPWSQINLNKATIQQIDKYIGQLKKLLEFEKNFRIVHLTIVNNDVQRVMLMSDLGTAVAIDLESGSWCHTSVAGNGPLQFGTKCSD